MGTPMRSTVRVGRLHRARRARAAMMLFIILVGLPMLFFGGAISVDYTRIVIAQRQASQLADAASLAGTMQVVPNDPLDPEANSSDLLVGKEVTLYDGTPYRTAEQEVERFFANISEQFPEAVNRLRIESVTTEVVRQASDGNGPSTLAVTIEWQVDGLVFLGFLSDWFGDGERIDGGVTTRSSFVCEPPDEGEDTTGSLTYQGRCARPTSG